MKYNFYTYCDYGKQGETPLNQACKKPVNVPIDWNPTSIDYCKNKEEE